MIKYVCNNRDRQYIKYLISHITITITHERAPEFLSHVSQDTAFILGIKQLPTTHNVMT